MLVTNIFPHSVFLLSNCSIKCHKHYLEPSFCPTLHPSANLLITHCCVQTDTISSLSSPYSSDYPSSQWEVLRNQRYKNNDTWYKKKKEILERLVLNFRVGYQSIYHANALKGYSSKTILIFCIPGCMQLLFIYAVLNNFDALAEYFWAKGREAVAAALAASKLYKSMASLNFRDTNLKSSMLDNAK